MKKLLATLALVTLALAATSCNDKILVAKTVVAFMSLGEQTVDSVFAQAEKTKREECLKKGTEGSPEFNKCFEEMAKALKVWAEVEPKLELALENAAKYIKAAETGSGGDYAAAVKESVCLLTQILPVIPGDKWKKKIQAYLDLASTYACPAKSAIQIPTTQANQRYMAKRLVNLLTEMGVQADG